MATDQECTNSSTNIFQEMRTKLNQKFSEFDRLLTDHRKKLDLKIDQLEIEFTNKHKQIGSDKQTLTELHEQTQNKLGRTSLIEIQTKLLMEITDKLNDLKLENTKQNQLRFTLYWNQDDIIGLLNKIDMELIAVTVPQHDTPLANTGDTIPKEPVPPEGEYVDTYYATDNHPVSPRTTDAPAFYDSYNSWNGNYRDRRDPRGQRGGRRRDKYAY